MLAKRFKKQTIDCNCVCQVTDLSHQHIHMDKIKVILLLTFLLLGKSLLFFKVNIVDFLNLRLHYVYYFKNHILVSFYSITVLLLLYLFVSVLQCF